MMMTLRQLAFLGFLAGSKTPPDLKRFADAIDQRHRERGPAKLERRLRRKRELGMSGAF